MPIHMAKRRSNQRFGGIRSRLEKAIPSGRRNRKKTPGIAGSAMTHVSSAIDTVKGRVSGRDAKRSEAAKKAARTRKRNAERRSAAARKGARTRARAGAR
jgi:hypothetical protein